MQTPKKVMIGAAVAASMFAMSIPAIANAATTTTVDPTATATATFDPTPIPTVTGTAAPVVAPVQSAPGAPPSAPASPPASTDPSATPVPTATMPSGGINVPVGTQPQVISPLEAVAIRTGGRVVLGDTKGTALVNSKIAGTITQDYDNGTVIWNPLKNEGHAVVGNKATVWSNAATDLGEPTGDSVDTSDGGSVQNFEHGKIVSDSKGASKVVK